MDDMCDIGIVQSQYRQSLFDLIGN